VNKSHDTAPIGKEIISAEALAEIGISSGPGAWERLAELADDVEMISIHAAILDGSPRLDGEVHAHAEALAEIGNGLPPIIVHRASMRVIDGRHRVLAGQLRGQELIATRYFDGSHEDAYLLAVKANVSHGLPLPMRDREEAATRILASRESWSDRAIAQIVGLSAKTVGAIRRRSSEDLRQTNARVGRDGRIRPLNVARGRIRASQLIAARPQASIREIAREAGISVGTAHDVSERVRKGLDPVPSMQRDRRKPELPVEKLPGHVEPNPDPDLPVDLFSKLRRLRNDPSVRYTEGGRNLIRWLEMHISAPDSWRTMMAAVPAHQAFDIADLAHGLAAQWQQMAQELAEPGRETA
jgi:transposase